MATEFLSINLVKGRYAELSDKYDPTSQSMYHKLIGEELTYLLAIKKAIEEDLKPVPELTKEQLEIARITSTFVMGAVNSMGTSGERKQFFQEIIKQLNNSKF